MPFPAPVLRPDPRLKHRIAYYNRNEIVADLVSFYEFLPHVITSTVHVAPAEGWSEITLASLAVHGIHKTSEVVELLRHLPYLSGDKPWIMIVAMACDYRQVIVSPIAREKPGWMFDAADKQWPAWVIQLTAGTDLEGSHYMPDTTDGNISRHCVGGRFDYPPTYVSEDARSWRDRECDPETVSLREWLEQWREQYLQMTVVTLPPDVLSYGSVDPFFGALEAAPSSYYFEEVDSMRKIYREHGWPDLDKYQKEACVRALKLWYQGLLKARRVQDEIELRKHWEACRTTKPEPSTIVNAWE